MCQTWKTCHLPHHIAALSFSRNVLTVTVCLSKASAYLTGGDVNIFTQCALIGFLVKYSMVFLRFFCYCWGFIGFGCRFLHSSKTPKSFCFLSCTETILKLRALALKHREFLSHHLCWLHGLYCWNLSLLPPYKAQCLELKSMTWWELG